MATALRPPVKWHGGKHYLARRIIEQFPAHHTYVEPFGGAASVLLNKERSPVEVYNDLDERVTRLFRVLREHGEELHRRLRLTPYSEIEFACAADNPIGEREFVRQLLEPKPDEIELARRDFVRWRLSLGGRGQSFSYTCHRVRRGMADVVSGYLSAIDEELPRIIERLRSVQIVCRDAVDVIETWDSADTLIYCDPPYVASTRASPSVYAREMSEEDHRDLAAALRACKGQVILSGYPSALYDALYGDWQQVRFDMPNNAAGGSRKARKEEVLWLNFETASGRTAQGYGDVDGGDSAKANDCPQRE